MSKLDSRWTMQKNVFNILWNWT